MSRLARKLDCTAGDIPSWCRQALTLERIERVGTLGCFWLIFVSEDARLVHAAGQLPGSELDLTDYLGRPMDEILSSELLPERAAALDRVLARSDEPHLVIDMWKGREIWTVCEVEHADDGHRGVLGIGYRPCVDQSVPEHIDTVRFRRVSDPGPLADLTLGELEILRLLALGHSREEMSHEVHRTLKAVERRRTNLGRKLGQASTHRLTLTALRAGLHRLSDADLEQFWRDNASHGRHSRLYA
jgi:DNA-binding CsgD family transcriptional regulator